MVNTYFQRRTGQNGYPSATDLRESDDLHVQPRLLTIESRKTGRDVLTSVLPGSFNLHALYPVFPF